MMKASLFLALLVLGMATSVRAGDLPEMIERFVGNQSTSRHVQANITRLFVTIGIKKTDPRAVQLEKCMGAIQLGVQDKLPYREYLFQFFVDEFTLAELRAEAKPAIIRALWNALRTTSGYSLASDYGTHLFAMKMLTAITPADAGERRELAREWLRPSLTDVIKLYRRGTPFRSDLTEALLDTLTDPKAVDKILADFRAKLWPPFPESVDLSRDKATALVAPVVEKEAGDTDSSLLKLRTALILAAEMKLKDAAAERRAVELLSLDEPVSMRGSGGTTGALAIRYLKQAAVDDKRILESLVAAPFKRYYMRSADGDMYQESVWSVLAASKSGVAFKLLCDDLGSTVDDHVVGAHDALMEILAGRHATELTGPQRRALRRALSAPWAQEITLRGDGNYAGLIRLAGSEVPLVMYAYADVVPNEILLDPKALLKLVDEKPTVGTAHVALRKFAKHSFPADAKELKSEQAGLVKKLIIQILDRFGPLSDPALVTTIGMACVNLDIHDERILASLRTADMSPYSLVYRTRLVVQDAQIATHRLATAMHPPERPQAEEPLTAGQQEALDCGKRVVDGLLDMIYRAKEIGSEPEGGEPPKE